MTKNVSNSGQEGLKPNQTKLPLSTSGEGLGVRENIGHQPVKPSELREKVGDIRGKFEDAMTAKNHTEEERYIAEFQTAVSSVYSLLNKILFKEKARDIDFVLLSSEDCPDKCFGIGGHPTDSRAHIDIWVKGKEEDGVTIAFDANGQFIIKKTNSIFNGTSLSIKSIPDAILNYCKKGNRNFKHKLIKGAISLVTVSDRMHELAQRPPMHKREFSMLSRGINNLHPVQEELKNTYNFLQDLLYKKFGNNVKYHDEMLILDGSASNPRDEGLVHIEQHGGIIEVGIIGEPENNVFIYQDRNRMYCIKKVRPKFKDDRNLRDGPKSKDKITQAHSRGHLMDVKAIPGLVRDLMEYEYRKEGLKKYGINPNKELLELLHDRIKSKKETQEGTLLSNDPRMHKLAQKPSGKRLLASIDPRMHALVQQPPQHLRQFNHISEGANELEVHQKELSDIFQYLEALCKDNGIIDNKEILEIDLHPEYKHATKKLGLICIRKNGDLFELGTTGESNWNVIFYRDKKGIYCIRKSGAKSSFSNNIRNRLLGVEAIPGPIRDFMKYEGRLEGAKITTLMRDPKKKFIDFTHVGIFSCSAPGTQSLVINNFAVQPIVARGPGKKSEQATPTGTDEATGLDKF